VLSAEIKQQGAGGGNFIDVHQVRTIQTRLAVWRSFQGHDHASRSLRGNQFDGQSGLGSLGPSRTFMGHAFLPKPTSQSCTVQIRGGD